MQGHRTKCALKVRSFAATLGDDTASVHCGLYFSVLLLEEVTHVDRRCNNLLLQLLTMCCELEAQIIVLRNCLEVEEPLRSIVVCEKRRLLAVFLLQPLNA